MALSSLAAGHARLDDLTAAVRHSDEAMAIHTRLDDQPAHGESLVPIAKVYVQAGHTDSPSLRSPASRHPASPT